MAASGSDARFAGSIPEIYDSQLVPLIFEPYAEDLARRVMTLQPKRVLELAAGTGAVTRAMARTLPASTEIVATDLNPAMLERAARVGTARPVQWQAADAMRLPFDDASFDAVVCQFGVMFFPDKPAALAEARRVLRRGGTLLLNVWDSLEQNDFPRVITQALAEAFPDDPPRFLARTPYGYFDPRAIERDVLAGGFAVPRIDTLAARSRAATAMSPAVGFCQGSPLRSEIEARPGMSLAQATDVCAAAIARRFGSGPVDGKIQALVVTVS